MKLIANTISKALVQDLKHTQNLNTKHVRLIYTHNDTYISQKIHEIKGLF